MKPTLKPPGTKRLKLKRDMLLSTSAFKFHLRRYIPGSLGGGSVGNGDGSGQGAGAGLLSCPALFIYSAADPLIPFRGVEAFAAARAARLGGAVHVQTV
jgi:hypothetical protein